MSIVQYIPFKIYFLYIGISKIFKPLAYIYYGILTFFILLINNPKIIWLQIPPSPVLHVAFIYKTILFRRRTIIIADCHNGAFISPFINFPFVVRLLNRCDVVLVHNPVLEGQVESFGIRKAKVAVLTDPPTKPPSIQLSPLKIVDGARRYLVFPCSYAKDEPLEAIMRAMSYCRDIDLYLTGNFKKAQGLLVNLDIPNNVKFTGFLSEIDLDRLIYNSLAVIAFTTVDNIQLCSAAEGIGLGKPLILADRKAVREIYRKGRVLVEPTNHDSIAAGIKKLEVDINKLGQEAQELRLDLEKIWHYRALKIFGKYGFLKESQDEPVCENLQSM